MPTNECDSESEHEIESTEVNKVKSSKDEKSPKVPKVRLTGRIKKRVVDDKKVALEINAIKSNLLLAEYVYEVDAANWEKKVAAHEVFVAHVTNTLAEKVLATKEENI